MNMERKYIEKVLEDMKDRLECLKELIKMHENDIKSCKDEKLDWAEGYHKGHLNAFEREIEFLEVEIKFLSGALETN